MVKAFEGQKNQAKIIVLCTSDKAELEHLKRLPQGSQIVAHGQSVEDFANQKDKISQANCILFAAGTQQALIELWPQFKNLEWIHSLAAGVNGLTSVPQLVESNVILTNCKGVYNNSLAEYTMAACGWFAKRLETIRINQKQSKWQPIVVEELRGKTFGVIGYGDIGRRCAELARAYKMRVVVLKRRPEDAQKEVESGLLDKVYSSDKATEMVKECDYCVSVLPHTPSTVKFVSKEIIQSMKPSMVFISIGRGTTVDEEALIAALQNNKIRGAALDVTYVEPLPKESPLYQMENVLLSPHCADLTSHMFEESCIQYTEFVNDFQLGKGLVNVVDKKAGY